MAFPSHVAPNELIQSAWGNDVVDSLGFHQQVLDYHWSQIVARSSVLASLRGAGLANYRLRIQGLTSVFTTDINGLSWVNYPVPFETFYFNVVGWPDGTYAALQMGIWVLQYNEYGFMVRTWQNNVPAPNATVRLDWLAVGLA